MTPSRCRVSATLGLQIQSTEWIPLNQDEQSRVSFAGSLILALVSSQVPTCVVENLVLNSHLLGQQYILMHEFTQ